MYLNIGSMKYEENFQKIINRNLRFKLQKETKLKVKMHVKIGKCYFYFTFDSIDPFLYICMQ